MYATFNDNLCTTIISCYSPTNASDEMDITTCYYNLSSFAQHISKHNVVIINREMNAQIGKERNGKYLIDFSLKNSFSCLITKLQNKDLDQPK